jgi:hypothetical protein
VTRSLGVQGDGLGPACSRERKSSADLAGKRAGRTVVLDRLRTSRRVTGLRSLGPSRN